MNRAKYSRGALAYRPTESSFTTYEKWIILRYFCTNSSEPWTDAGYGMGCN